MSLLSQILIGMAGNTGYAIVQSLLPFRFSDHSIQKAIQEAYKRALQQWTVNRGIRDREEIYLQHHLAKAITQLSENPFAKGAGNDLLALFRAELEKDDRTQGFLHYCLSQDTNKVAHQILQIVHPQETHRSSYANDFFIQEIAPAECYIPRTVRLISRPQQTTDDVLPEGEYALIDLIARHPRLVILGSAGMGKSTELRQLALRLTETYCPCHLPLNTFTDARNLDQMLHPQWLNADQPKVLLLDGLDEVLPEDTERVKREIGRLANTYREIPIIVSCRSNFYTLPVDGVGGSLSGFAAVILEPLTTKAVRTYIFQTYPAIDSEEFLFQVHRRGLTVLLENPFWVIAMIEFYQEHKNLGGNITELLEYLIERNFERDAGHYDGSIPLKEQRYELFRSLETVACCMNMVGTRTIPDAEVSALLSDREAYRLIRCSGTLAKNDASDRFKDTWQFKHGYFQEFLTARLLSRQTFDQILVLIRSASDTVLPGWQNTLTLMLNMLPSRSELFQQLVDWFSAHDPAALIAMEPEKLNNDLRTRIFKSIFNYYKEKDIRLDRDKVDSTELARFGGNDDCIRFLIDEVCDVSTPRRIRLNALDILQYFDYSTQVSSRPIIIDRLMQVLANADTSDDYLISQIVKTIHKIDPTQQTVEIIYERLKNETGDSIRSSLYDLLQDKQLYERHIDYFLDGLLATNRLFGLELKILDVLRQCKTPQALHRILEFWTKHVNNLEDHSLNEFLKPAQQIIQNAVNAYGEDSSMYLFVQQLFLQHCKQCFQNRVIYIDTILVFFDRTNTRERLYTEILQQVQIDKNTIDTLSFTLTPAFFPLLIQAYRNQVIDSEYLDLICRDVQWNRPELFESLKQAVESATDIRIVFPPAIDWDEIHRRQMQEAFDILFDPTGFQMACMNLLGDRPSLSHQEYCALHSNFLKTPHNPGDELANQYVLHWISDMTKESALTPSSITQWFDRPENMERFAIYYICQALTSNDSLTLSAFQEGYLHQWFDQNIDAVDFTRTIDMSNDYRFTWNRKAQWLVILLHRFHFHVPDSILLDLTHCCFANTHSHWQAQWPITLQYIEERISTPHLLQKRIVMNIKEHAIRIPYIYDSHVRYVFEYRLTETYGVIAQDLACNIFDNERWREPLVELSFKIDNAFSALISCWDQMDLNLKLIVARELSKIGHHTFISQQLPQLYEQCENATDQRNVCALLIRAGDIRGLEFSIRWAKQYMRSPFSQNGCNPAYFENLDALPALMILLELSYDPQIATDHELDRMLPLVMAGLQHLALAKRDNYGPVTETIHRFMAEHSSLPDILFLNTYLEQMKQEFGVKYAPTYSWHEARQLISQQKLS